MTPAKTIVPRRSWNRLDGVDLLRGVAIFFVLMNHVNMRLRGAGVPYTDGLPSQLVSSLVWNGQRGVQMFFAISGFLITSTSIRRWGALVNLSARDFYRLRFARIVPLLLALLALLSCLHLAGLTDFVVSSKTGGLGRALAAALTFHVNVLEADRGYLPANWDILWSLSIEEAFYIFFPLVCLLVRNNGLLSIVLSGFVIAGPFGRTVLTHGNPVWREYSYLGGMDAIALGCLTAMLLSRADLSRTLRRTFVALGTAFLAFTLFFSEAPGAMTFRRYGLDMTIVAAGTCLVIAAVAKMQWTAPVVARPLLALGRRSYEVYLTHMFVVFAFFNLFVAAGKPIRTVPLLFVAVLLGAGCLGAAVAHLYSEPVNRLLRKRWGDGPDRLGSAVLPENEQVGERVAV